MIDTIVAVMEELIMCQNYVSRLIVEKPNFMHSFSGLHLHH